MENRLGVSSVVNLHFPVAAYHRGMLRRRPQSLSTPCSVKSRLDLYAYYAYSQYIHTTWDPEKAKENRTKHGAAFPDAEPVLFDTNAITREDEQAEGEQRFVTVGLDALGRVVVVVYTYRGRPYE